MKKLDLVQRQLRQMLKRQEQEMRKIRRDKGTSSYLLWSRVRPRNRPEIIKSFFENGVLENFMKDLPGEESRQEVWNDIDDFTLAQLIESDTSQMFHFILQSTQERQVQFMNSKNAYEIYKLLEVAEMQEKIHLVAMFSDQKLADFLDHMFQFRTFYTFAGFLGQFCEIDAYEGGKEVSKKVFSVVANMPAKRVAKILESSGADIVCNVFQQIPQELIYAILEEVTDKKLYEVIEKCGVLSFAELTDLQFPWEKLSDEEKRAFYQVLEHFEVNACKVFDMVGLASLFSVVDKKEKEIILSNVSNLGQNFESLKRFYELLEKSEKRDMIEILATSHSQFAIQLLEEDTGNLGFWERLALEKLKSETE